MEPAMAMDRERERRRYAEALRRALEDDQTLQLMSHPYNLTPAGSSEILAVEDWW